MAKPYLQFKTPVVDLEWVTIIGDGKPNMGGDKFFYTATAVFNEATATSMAKEFQEFWLANRPKGALAKQKKPMIKPLMVKTDDVDEDGDPIKVHKTNDAGEKLFTLQAKTGVVDYKGKPSTIAVLNSKGKKVNLGDKEIGNGSRGVIHGSVGIYNVDGSSGLTYYLNKIQLTKFVEYEAGGTEVEDLGDETEGLDGLEESVEEDAVTEPKNTPDV